MTWIDFGLAAVKEKMKTKNFNLKNEKEVAAASVAETPVFIRSNDQELKMENLNEPGSFPIFYGQD